MNLHIPSSELKPPPNWDRSGIELNKAVSDFADYGIETILLTAIKKDGMLEGPDMETLRKIRNNTSIQIQASGGIRDRKSVV